jgi:hypothetical protein
LSGSSGKGSRRGALKTSLRGDFNERRKENGEYEREKKMDHDPVGSEKDLKKWSTGEWRRGYSNGNGSRPFFPFLCGHVSPGYRLKIPVSCWSSWCIIAGL